RLTLRHRFAKRGRNISADVQMGHNQRDGDRGQFSLDEFQGGAPPADTVNQQTATNSVTNSVSTRIAYTEPIVPGWQAQVTYNPQWTKSTADARTLAADANGQFTQLDPTQSNSFENRNTAQNAGAAVLWTKGVWRLL